MDRLNEMTGREDTEQSLEGATQREVNLAVDRKDHEDLSILIEESGSIRDEARLGSLGLPNAGSWLNVIPSPALVHLKPYFHSLSLKKENKHPILWAPRANSHEAAKAVIQLGLFSGRYRVAMLTRHLSPSRSGTCSRLP